MVGVTALEPLSAVVGTTAANPTATAAGDVTAVLMIGAVEDSCVGKP